MRPEKRHMRSFPMISIKDAWRKMRDITSGNLDFRKMPFETVPLSDAYGKILYEKSIKSTCNLPPFKASTKHGYAVQVTDGKGLRKVLKNTVR